MKRRACAPRNAGTVCFGAGLFPDYAVRCAHGSILATATGGDEPMSRRRCEAPRLKTAKERRRYLTMRPI
jgi:hypothetical protein